ncbi:DNA adenine methylase [Pedobacter panaciterrae]|uniref:site-specific DNA-methyltransferase (adenine-specific) n=1 Tax=Pedobacter panaciterrae TaxID=363849 RepID=A0ABU8NS16_9SPHI
MILRRNGNKSQIARLITPHFPEHKIYIEPFFGAGGMFFNKPKAKYNFLNDLDDDVFNLFMVIKNRREELYRSIELMPIHQTLMKLWKKNKEDDDLWRAVRFLFISNFTYLSKGYNIKFTADNSKDILLSRIEPTFEYMKDARFMNVDFRKVLKMISFGDESALCKRSDSFIYSDGPYFETDGWYTENSNKEQDVIDHFDMLCNSGIRFGMSEFDNPFILDNAKQRGLNVITIGERRNLKNRRTEVLITNYEPTAQQSLFNIAI